MGGIKPVQFSLQDVIVAWRSLQPSRGAVGDNGGGIKELGDTKSVCTMLVCFIQVVASCNS